MILVILKAKLIAIVKNIKSHGQIGSILILLTTYTLLQHYRRLCSLSLKYNIHLLNRNFVKISKKSRKKCVSLARGRVTFKIGVDREELTTEAKLMDQSNTSD